MLLGHLRESSVVIANTLRIVTEIVVEVAAAVDVRLVLSAIVHAAISIVLREAIIVLVQKSPLPLIAYLVWVLVNPVAITVAVLGHYTTIAILRVLLLELSILVRLQLLLARVIVDCLLLLTKPLLVLSASSKV